MPTLPGPCGAIRRPAIRRDGPAASDPNPTRSGSTTTCVACGAGRQNSALPRLPRAVRLRVRDRISPPADLAPGAVLSSASTRTKTARSRRRSSTAPPVISERSTATEMGFSAKVRPRRVRLQAGDRVPRADLANGEIVPKVEMTSLRCLGQLAPELADLGLDQHRQLRPQEVRAGEPPFRLGEDEMILEEQGAGRFGQGGNLQIRRGA